MLWGCTLSAAATSSILEESSANVCPIKFIVTSLQKFKGVENCTNTDRGKARTGEPTQMAKSVALPAFHLAPLEKRTARFFKPQQSKNQVPPSPPPPPLHIFGKSLIRDKFQALSSDKCMKSLHLPLSI